VCGCRTERWARRAAHRSRVLRTVCPETRSGMGAANSSPRRESDRAQAEMPTKSGDCWMRRHRAVLQVGTCERAAIWHAWLSATGVYRNNTLLHTQVKGVPPHSKATHQNGLTGSSPSFPQQPGNCRRYDMRAQAYTPPIAPKKRERQKPGPAAEAPLCLVVGFAGARSCALDFPPMGPLVFWCGLPAGPTSSHTGSATPVTVD